MKAEASEHLSEELGQRYKATLIIILAQIFIVILLVIIAWFLAPRLDLPISAQATSALWILIFVLIGGVFLLRRYLFLWTKIKLKFAEKGLSETVKLLQINTVLLGVLCETIALIGFLIASMNGNKFEMFRAGAISFVGFLMIFPRKEVWEKIIAGVKQNSAELKG